MKKKPRMLTFNEFYHEWAYLKVVKHHGFNDVTEFERVTETQFTEGEESYKRYKEWYNTEFTKLGRAMYEKA